MTLPAALDFKVNPEASPARMNEATEHLDQRLSALEIPAKSLDTYLAQLQAIGLARVADAVKPVYDALAAIAQLGAIFTTSSASTVTVQTGTATFVVAQADRAQFAAAAYLGVQSVDEPGTFLTGPLQSYDRKTGILSISVQQFTGTGNVARSNWRISASASPSFVATAHGVGTYTSAEIDSQITAAKNYADSSAASAAGTAQSNAQTGAITAIRDGVATGGNTLAKLFTLINNLSTQLSTDEAAIGTKVQRSGDTLTGNLSISTASYPAFTLTNGTNNWTAQYNTNNGNYDVSYNGTYKLSVQQNGDFMSPVYNGSLYNWIEARCAAYVANRIPFSSATSFANASQVAQRDGSGRCNFTDVLGRSSGNPINDRSSRLGGFAWIDNGAYIEMLVDSTARAITTQASDVRFKTNIERQDARDELSLVERLRFVSFDWIEGVPEKGHRELGLIAQEIETIKTEWVIKPLSEEHGQGYALDMQGLLLSALRSCQQLSEKLHAAEARLDALEAAR